LAATLSARLRRAPETGPPTSRERYKRLTFAPALPSSSIHPRAAAARAICPGRTTISPRGAAIGPTAAAATVHPRAAAIDPTAAAVVHPTTTTIDPTLRGRFTRQQHGPRHHNADHCSRPFAQPRKKIAPRKQ